MTYIVSARTATSSTSWSNRETASVAGTAKTLFSGNVALTTKSLTTGYEMRDPSRGGSYTINGAIGTTSGQIYKDADNVWGNNTTSDGASAAADAQFGAATTWDYYKNSTSAGMASPTPAGAPTTAFTIGRKYDNAFWSDSLLLHDLRRWRRRTVIGPLVSLDIAGHEMSHGVNESHREPDLLRRIRRPERGQLRHLRHHGRVLRQQHARHPGLHDR